MKAKLPQRLLIVRLGAIGDVVNALVFATAIKEADPSIHIGWVVHNLAQPMVSGNPSVDRVHVWPKGGGIAAFSRMIREVRGQSYDMAVDLQRIQKSSIVARLSGAGRVLGYHRSRTKEGSWLWTKERGPAFPPETHMVDQYMGLARHLGIDSPAKHVLPENEEAESWAERTVAEYGSAPILVNLGATKPANRWVAHRFGTLAEELQREFNDPVVLIGSEADRETERAALAALPEGHRIQSSVGATDLMQLLALERRARLFVGCDTGPMHMAAAVGTPCVVLFGPADPRRTGPYGAVDKNDRQIPEALHRIVRVSPACAPCNRKECNQPVHACMEDIRVEHVLSACRDALKRSDSASNSK